ncbi:YkyA family protein [Macrococcoides caseolyticum]|uniref:YkyA family protein n=1 Tax=Macrococcoides caseolyticum TaxID=69966 RepID=UPI001F4091DA|nr:YkyA family protein [Macrococcus caseolyticus]MCE4956921.1 YkyA family protein [Macrococcus caseolyticus]
MKKLKGLFLVSLMVLLVACSNKTANLEAFYKQVDEANKVEKELVESSSKLEKLENKKLDLFNKVNKAKEIELKGIAEDLIKNTDERKAIADKEIKAMAKSKKLFEASKKDAKAVEDKEQKKQVEPLVSSLDDKYEKHETMMKAYQEILKKEKDLFNTLKATPVDKNLVNEKIGAVTKLYKQFQGKTDAYTKVSRQVETNKRPIVKTLNEG